MAPTKVSIPKLVGSGMTAYTPGIIETEIIRSVGKFGQNLSKLWGIMDVAEMSSGGPWYRPVVRANAMLGHRAARKGWMSYRDVEAQIEAKLLGGSVKTDRWKAPSQQTVRNWEKEHPDYPEWAVHIGLISETDLLPWAREQLKFQAPMSQLLQSDLGHHRRSQPGKQQQVPVRSKQGIPASPGPEDNASEVPPFVQLLLFVGALWVVGKLLDGQRQTAPSVLNPYQEDLSGRHRQRVTSGGRVSLGLKRLGVYT
jgi:hypothetical protein